MVFKPKDIISIAKKIELGHIGIFPFDTLIGLTGILSETSINKVIHIKKRDSSPFIILIPNLTFLPKLVDSISTYQKNIISNYWPGPFTFIFKKNKSVSDFVTSSKPTIAIRFANFLPLNFLLSELNQPIFSTSVNLHGHSAATTFNRIHEDILAQSVFY